MTAAQIRTATENMTFEQACVYIENLNLQLVISENYPYLKFPSKITRHLKLERSC
jgi:hypothetical protein